MTVPPAVPLAPTPSWRADVTCLADEVAQLLSLLRSVQAAPSTVVPDAEVFAVMVGDARDEVKTVRMGLAMLLDRELAARYMRASRRTSSCCVWVSMVQASVGTALSQL